MSSDSASPELPVADLSRPSSTRRQGRRRVDNNNRQAESSHADTLQQGQGSYNESSYTAFFAHSQSAKSRQHRTGCVIGCLRRCQSWSLTSIFDEYRRYSTPKSRAMDLQFIEAFAGLPDVSLAGPRSLNCALTKTLRRSGGSAIAINCHGGPRWNRRPSPRRQTRRLSRLKFEDARSVPSRLGRSCKISTGLSVHPLHLVE